MRDLSFKVFISFLTLTLSQNLLADQFLDKWLILDRQEAEGLVSHSSSDTYRPKSLYPIQQAKAELMMKQVYDSAKKELSGSFKTFPPMPLIFLTDSNSFVPVSTNKVISTSNIITVNIEDLENKSLYGILAHELGHYLLIHGKVAEEDKTITNFYTSEQNPNGCTDEALDIVRDQTLSEEMEDLLETISKTTLIHNEETRGIPLDISDNDNLFQVLRELLIKKNQGPSNMSCRLAIEAMDTAVVDVFVASCSMKGRQTCELTPELELLKIKALENLEKSAMKCLESDYPSFLEFFTTSSGLPILEMEKDKETYDALNVRQKEKFQILKNGNHPLTVLKALHSTDQEVITSGLLKNGLTESSIRFISDEDQADIIGQIIVSNLPMPGIFEESRLLSMKPKERDACVQLVQDGKEPAYGFLGDLHHSSCWRYWRATKLSAEIKDQDKKSQIIQKLININFNSQTEN